ncbi:hypothetical protein DXG03_007211 [Asterophora parasitica]|uniref:tRNA isopentenyltransferase n=1 Tax=Asterophora parasitica TaxID=117018 RepID=A0A9P7G6M7_9AGAR|nr:hypothetical protein DXG03_007211 [Asterophora parasitica]
MQVYSGMDVITNKVPEAERHGVEHLLMGFKSPGEQYVVGQWVQDALKAIDETHKRNEIPIVVGGTSYWIQHLMFPNRLAVDKDSSPMPAGRTPMSQELADIVAALPLHLLALFNCLPLHPPSAATDPDAAFNLHTLLSMLDLPVANRWHWRDTRKVLRSLGVIKETGKRASEIIMDQTNDLASSKPRFIEFEFTWLLSEIRALRQIATAASREESSSDSAGVKTDYTLGIYQSIGYKEFHDYLTASEPSEKGFDAAVEHMKVSTRQYAKRQVGWIRNKLLPAVNTANAEEAVTPTYLLDATALDSWDKNVRGLGVQLTEDFLAKREMADPLSLSESARKMMLIDSKAVDPASVLNARQKRICHVCTLHIDRPFMVEEGREWEAHRNTRVHRKLAAKGQQSEHGEVHQQRKTKRDEASTRN